MVDVAVSRGERPVLWAAGMQPLSGELGHCGLLGRASCRGAVHVIRHQCSGSGQAKGIACSIGVSTAAAVHPESNTPCSRNSPTAMPCVTSTTATDKAAPAATVSCRRRRGTVCALSWSCRASYLLILLGCRAGCHHCSRPHAAAVAASLRQACLLLLVVCSCRSWAGAAACHAGAADAVPVAARPG